MPRNKSSRYLCVIASIMLAFFLGWIALRSADLGSVQAAFGKVSWNILLLAFSAVVFSIFLQAVRWKLLLHTIANELAGKLHHLDPKE